MAERPWLSNSQKFLWKLASVLDSWAVKPSCDFLRAVSCDVPPPKTAFFCRKVHLSAGNGIFLQESAFFCRKMRFFLQEKTFPYRFFLHFAPGGVKNHEWEFVSGWKITGRNLLQSPPPKLPGLFSCVLFSFCSLCWPPLSSPPPSLGTFPPFSSPWKVLCSVEQRGQHTAGRGAVSGLTTPQSSGRKFLPEICMKNGQLPTGHLLFQQLIR